MTILSRSSTRLSPEQRRSLVAELMDQQGPIASPLSFAQQRLWILDRFQPGNPAYNIPAAIPLQGWLNMHALERSLNEIVRRHETLRTRFEVIDGKPAQVVEPSLQIPLEIMDLRSVPPTAVQAEVSRIVFEEGRRSFDLSKGPLIRALLLKINAMSNVLVLVMHHIVSDGWSMSVFNRELSTLYTAYLRGQQSPFPEFPIQYSDFAAWQTEWFRGEVLEEQLGYWRKQLAGLHPVLALPTDRPRPLVQTNNGALVGFIVDHGLCEDLKSFSQSRNATLFMTLLAAFKTLLYRLSGETDIAVGSPIANRTRSELEGLIGFFVNTLVLRTDLSGDPTFIELLAREREMALGAFGHQDMPFEKLVEELQPNRDLSHNPLFQILFAVQNIGTVDRNAPQQQPPSAGLPLGNGTAKFDLTLSLLDTGGGAQGLLEYNTDLFNTSTAEMIVERYQTLLRGVVEDPTKRLSQLPIFTIREREEPPVGLAGPKIASGMPETVSEVVSAHATGNPQAVAAVGPSGEISYLELERRTDQLAAHLLSRGANKECSIAVAMSRDLENVVAVLSVLKAGWSYIPIDSSELVLSNSATETLPSRINRILAEAKPMMILVDDVTRSGFPSDLSGVVLFSQLESDAQSEDLKPDLSVTPDSIASMVYQAGPDGTLHAFALTHRALCRIASEPQISLKASDRVAHVSYAASDSSRYEIFGALAASATIVCLPNEALSAPRRFANALRESGVTVLFARAATIEHLAREFPWALRNIRLLLIDERITDSQRLLEVLKHELRERVFSLYGDVAAGGFFAVQPLGSLAPDARTIPLGSPTPGVTLYALDKNLELVPPGVVGEIYLESETLAVNGSNAQDSLITSPFSSSTKTQLYRTGDIARQLLDGSLEYRGRRDGRIVSGTANVYPAEIESVLVQHSTVRDAAVAPRRRQGLRDRGLAALVETEADELIESDLRDFLAANLPAHLIPTAFVTVKTLPHLVDGQIDRQLVAEAVADIDTPQPASEPYVEPRNDIETALAQIWMETLGTARIGIKDNFFRLGGHSLLATQAVARISDAFNIDLQLQRLFESPTIEQLAQVIEPLARADFKPKIMSIKRVPRDRPLPLSFAQQRLWFLDQFEPDSAFYNIAIPIRWPGPVDANALEAAFNDLIKRHETLRTTFAIVDAEPVQVIAPSYELSLIVHDLRHLPAKERMARAQTLAAIEAQRPFNLKSGPVLRAELVKMDDADHLLLFTIHHIAADGWSTEVLFRELFQLYEARRNGRVADLPELVVQYADFACWQRKRLTGALLDKQLAYWKRQLQDAPALLELPTDRPRPRVQMFRGAMHMFSMPGLILESVREIAQQDQTTLFTVLLAALNVLLYRYTGREDLVVGSPIANRTRPELESLIGFFANTLVLRTEISGKMTFRELVSQVREVTLGAYAHQDIPFEKLVEEFQPERNLSYNPLFQIMFALQNTGRPLVAGSSQDDSMPVVGAGVAKFDLTLFVSETTSGLKAGIEYNSDLFDTSTIARFASHYEALLQSISNDPDRQIWTLPMLSTEESVALVDWNDTAVPFRRECIQQMFEAQVEKTPDATAIIFNNLAISYRELNSRANDLAHRLIVSGIGPNLPVGIFMERSPEMIVAIMAILKAGGAYLPVDPNYPQERISFMLADSHAPIVITETHLRAKLPSTEANILTINDVEPGPKRDENPSSTVTAEDLAYVIYTSGSTGDPKGVAMPHAPLANLLQWQIPRSNLPPNARTLQFASLSFDVSFQEIFATLCSAGSLVIVTEDQRRDPPALWNVLSAEKVNRLFLPYVALQQLAEHAKKTTELPSSLTEVITAGEQLQITPQIAAMFERLNASLYNQYGPTESHVVTELKLMGAPRDWPARPSIGKPIQNAAVHVLDEFGQTCAIGTPGELHIGGEMLARGYLGRQALTAESFIAGSQPAGSRIYRTGDRARYLADGNIQFLGRMDDQVKIRGFRVEPGEIEAALRKHPLVSEAVVVARAHAAEQFRLAAYVGADPRHPPTVQELRRHLASLLPEYMMPSSFAVIGSLPLTPSGKLNRRALPAPDLPAAAELASAIAARTPVEEALTQIWREILELPRVGVQDNFFELGGHSLLATRVISRIRDEFNVDLPVRRMFETPTIEALALSVVEATLAAQSLDETAQLLAEIEQMSEEEARLSSAGD
jgi:amino acid adenylation domain-containing protein